MAELGALLRKAREDRGISLAEAEQATRIRRVFLQAIEEDRFQDLPGHVYGRGFISNYARYLGLDPAGLLREYERLATPEPTPVPQILNEPLAPLTHPVTRWLLLVLIVAALGVGAGYLYSHYWLDQGWRVQSLWPPVIGAPTTPAPEATPDPTHMAPTQPATRPGAPNVTPTHDAATMTPAPESEPTATLGPPATATATATPRPRPTATPTPIVGVNIEAFAQADTYLEVRADGELLWIGILRAGESNEWRADELMTLRVGNAGGLQLLVNGRDVGSLGASGQVINVEYRLGELP